MSVTQTSATVLPPRATQHLRCPRCQAHLSVQYVAPARAGFEHWTLRCAKCGTIQEAQVDADPMRSDALRWIGSRELLPPQ